jgi:hypothetical protein
MVVSINCTHPKYKMRSRRNKRAIRRAIQRNRKTYKTRKYRGGEVFSFPKVVPDDILFQDSDVCILKPDVKKGILIFSDYKLAPGSLCESGLKSGEQLQKEGIEFGRSKIHPYIFFRAPYASRPIDYTSIDTEITSSYNKDLVNRASLVWIRVDPEQTYTFSSEIRAKFSPQYRYGSPEYTSALESEVYKSRKTLSNYLAILDANAKKPVERYKQPLYNLITSELVTYVPYQMNSYGNYGDYGFGSGFGANQYPLDTDDINMNSEVLVRMPHLTSNYFVKCT